MNILENPDRPKSDMAGPTNPFYIKLQTEAEFARHTDDFIAERYPFKGRWQTYLNGNDLMIPEVYSGLLEDGGVVTNGTENQLLIFGDIHWNRMIRIVTTQLGIDPLMNDSMRWLYSRHQEFKELNEDGSITLSDELIAYAKLKAGVSRANGQGNVVIVGLLYYAEVHDKDQYDQLFDGDRIAALNDASGHE